MRVKHLSNAPHLLSVYWRKNPRGRTREKVFHFKKAKDLQLVRVFYNFLNHKMNMYVLCECFYSFIFYFSSNRQQIDKVVIAYSVQWMFSQSDCTYQSNFWNETFFMHYLCFFQVLAASIMGVTLSGMQIPSLTLVRNISYINNCIYALWGINSFSDRWNVR